MIIVKIIVKSITIFIIFPRWERFLCGPQLFIKLRSQQLKQSCDSFFLICSTNKCLGLSIKGTSVECFHMTSRRPYWCSKTMKRRPCWCPKPVLWELNSFLMQTLSFVPINLHTCWPREWRHSIKCFQTTSRRPYWCPKTMKRRPCWCPKPILWELNSFLMQTLSFVSVNLHRC